MSPLELDRYFDLLEVAIAEQDDIKIDLYLSRLSQSYASFSDEQLDIYNHAEMLSSELSSNIVFVDNDEDYYDDGQPSWDQEWHDFDPDC